MTNYRANEFRSLLEITDSYKIEFMTDNEELYNHVLKACKEAVEADKEEHAK